MVRSLAGVVIVVGLAACGDSEATMPDSSVVTPVATSYVTGPAPVIVTTLPPATTAPTPNEGTQAAGAPTGNETVAPGSTTSAAPECPTTHTVQEGETSRIEVAKKYGITYQQMDAANTDTSGYESFLVGIDIVIPCPS